MTRTFFLIIVFVFLLNSCKRKSENGLKIDTYQLTISLEKSDNNTIYLQKITSLTEIDSIKTKNGKAIFKGNVDSPERYLITIENIFGGKIIVLENDSITVTIKNKELLNATVSGSHINDELFKVQKLSKKIYDKIDLLFPDMQRARLENDVEKLQEISVKMKAIEQENTAFHFKYATQNPNSYISAMILSDLSKRENIDTQKITDSYNLLNENIKKSADGQKIANFIASLH